MPSLFFINGNLIVIQLQVKMDRACFCLLVGNSYLSLKNLWGAHEKIGGKACWEVSAIKYKIYLLVSMFVRFLERSMWDSCHVKVHGLTIGEYMDHTEIWPSGNIYSPHRQLKMGIHSKMFNTFKFNNNYSQGHESWKTQIGSWQIDSNKLSEILDYM